jgi:hypothetical protein
MLNTLTANAFIYAHRMLQGSNGETIAVAGKNYTCLPAELITGNRVWEQGGATDMSSLSVSILKEDMSKGPLTNTLATFRGLSMRVISVNDADTFWTLQLVQQRA